MTVKGGYLAVRPQLTSMARIGAPAYLPNMKRWILLALYLTPSAVLILLGVAGLVSACSPWLAARLGHAPLWLDVLLILIGGLNAARVLYVHIHLRGRVQRLLTSGQLHA